MATAATVHAHAPQGFIRKYIFSLDHKVIGIQYFFLALTAVFVGMFLSLLMRIHLVWPDAVLAAGGRDQAGDLSQPADHARHDHGVLRADHGAAGRLRKLLPADSDRRAGHGVSGPEHAVVLDDVRRVRRDHRGVLRDGRRAAARVDRVSAAERAAISGPGRGPGRRPVDHQHRDLLCGVADGRAELHHHDARSARQGHDADAHAAHRVVLVHHRDPGTAGFRRAALGRNSAAAGPQPRHQLLCSAGGGERPVVMGHKGGSPLLWQHLFWFFGHPEVYIAILPGMGVASQILSTFSRKPIFGYKAMVYAMLAIGFLGFMVWGHHMFMSGMSPYSAFAFSILTMCIGVPSAIKTFNWLGTLWKGHIRFHTPMLFAIGFVSLFVSGGLSGPFLAQPVLDIQLHDTYFVVGHFHLIMGVAAIFGIFAATYYWFPKMFGRMMNETDGQAALLHHAGWHVRDLHADALPGHGGTDAALLAVHRGRVSGRS